MRVATAGPTTTQSVPSPRLQRSAAAVIAQYIQDLMHPPEPHPCVPVA
jgi:hypothetical protein